MSRRGIRQRDIDALPQAVREQIEAGGTIKQSLIVGAGKPQTLVLPWPPSVNNMYATVGRRRVLSADGRSFKSAVRGACIEQKARVMHGDLAVEIVWHPPDNRVRDIDNPVKAVLDALKIAGVFARDDSQVRELHVRFADVSGTGGYVWVQIIPGAKQ